jgi:hypothetical protein
MRNNRLASSDPAATGPTLMTTKYEIEFYMVNTERQPYYAL